MHKILILLLFAIASPASALTANYEFDGPGVPADLFADLPPGFALTIGPSTATLTNPAGSGAGRLTTNQAFVGDFSAIAQVTAAGTPPGGATEGLAAYLEAGADPFATISSVFFALVATSPTGGADTLRVRSELTAQGGAAESENSPDTLGNAGFFQIARTGTTLTSSYCLGASLAGCQFLELASLTDPALGGAMRIGIFGTAAPGGSHFSGFDFLRIEYVPEPSTAILIALGAAILAAQRRD